MVNLVDFFLKLGTPHSHTQANQFTVKVDESPEKSLTQFRVLNIALPESVLQLWRYRSVREDFIYTALRTRGFTFVRVLGNSLHLSQFPSISIEIEVPAYQHTVDHIARSKALQKTFF